MQPPAPALSTRSRTPVGARVAAWALIGLGLLDAYALVFGLLFFSRHTSLSPGFLIFFLLVGALTAAHLVAGVRTLIRWPKGRVLGIVVGAIGTALAAWTLVALLLRDPPPPGVFTIPLQTLGVAIYATILFLLVRAQRA